LDWIEEEHENDIGQMEFEDMKFVVSIISYLLLLYMQVTPEFL